MKNFTTLNLGSDDVSLTKLLDLQARALVHAAKGLNNTELSIEAATSLELDLLEHPPAEAIAGGDIATRLDPQRLLLLTAGVSRISGRSIDSLTLRIFEAHPGISSGFDAGAIFALQALTSFDAVMAHRDESQNALLIPEFVLEDAARGTAFYAVKSSSCTQGTIALHLGGMRRFPRVEVEWVAAINNKAPSPELEALAESLAESWTTDRQLGSWVIYEGRCAEWRWLVSDSASQLSQRVTHPVAQAFKL